MVNKYLKYKSFVGERLEVVSFWQNKVTRGVALVVLSAALLGCSNTEGVSFHAKAETQTEVPKPTVAEKFSTIGKPTKTIETPWGPREVYDPIQDEEVQVAFSQFYKDSNEKSYFLQASSGYFGEPYLFEHEPELPENLKVSFRVLTEARKTQRQSLANTTTCKFIVDSACNAGWKVSPCDNDQCISDLSFVGNVYRTGCMIGGKQVYSISYHPIGEHFEPKSTEKEQIQNFFAIECNKFK